MPLPRSEHSVTIGVILEEDLKLDRAECVNLFATSLVLLPLATLANGHPALNAPLLIFLHVFATGPI